MCNGAAKRHQLKGLFDEQKSRGMSSHAVPNREYREFGEFRMDLPYRPIRPAKLESAQVVLSTRRTCVLVDDACLKSVQTVALRN